MATKAKNVTATQRKSIALGIVLAVIVVGVAVASVNLVGNAINNYKWTSAQPETCKGTLVSCTDTEGNYKSIPGTEFGLYEVSPGITTEYYIDDNGKACTEQYVDKCAEVKDEYGNDQYIANRCINPIPGRSGTLSQGAISSLESCRRWEKCDNGVCVPKGTSIN